MKKITALILAVFLCFSISFTGFATSTGVTDELINELKEKWKDDSRYDSVFNANHTIYYIGDRYDKIVAKGFDSPVEITGVSEDGSFILSSDSFSFSLNGIWYSGTIPVSGLSSYLTNHDIKSQKDFIYNGKSYKAGDVVFQAPPRPILVEVMEGVQMEELMKKTMPVFLIISFLVLWTGWRKAWQFLVEQLRGL